VQCYIVSKFPAVSLGLIKFISGSIEESGHCTFKNTHVFDFLWGVADTLEIKMRRLRLFAHQHDWVVASDLGRTAVFTRRLNHFMPM